MTIAKIIKTPPVENIITSSRKHKQIIELTGHEAFGYGCASLIGLILFGGLMTTASPFLRGFGIQMLYYASITSIIRMVSAIATNILRYWVISSTLNVLPILSLSHLWQT